MEKKLNHYLYCSPDELSQMFLSSFHIVSWCKIKTFFYHLFLTLLNTEQYLSIDGHYSDTTVLFTKLYVKELTTYLFLYFKILSDHHNCEASKKKCQTKRKRVRKLSRSILCFCLLCERKCLVFCLPKPFVDFLL